MKLNLEMSDTVALWVLIALIVAILAFKLSQFLKRLNIKKSNSFEIKASK